MKQSEQRCEQKTITAHIVENYFMIIQNNMRMLKHNDWLKKWQKIIKCTKVTKEMDKTKTAAIKSYSR